MRKPKGYWTYERCQKEASKYTTRKELFINNQSAYNSARKNGWLDIFYPKVNVNV